MTVSPSAAIGLASSVTVATTLPVALVGVIASAAGSELGFDPAAVGVIIGSYWLASSAAAFAGGPLVRRVPSRVLLIVSVAASLVSLVGTAVLSPAWPWLLFWAALGGAANALGHPASNALLHQRVGERRRALAFGIKQAAVPAASIVTGASLPLILVTFGWRWAVAPAAILVALLLVWALRAARASSARSSAQGRDEPVPRRARWFLIFVATTTFLASAHSNSMGAFAVTDAIARGIDEGAAGLLLVASSTVAVVVRVIVGLLAARAPRGALLGVGGLLLLGSVGLALMSIDDDALFIIGAMIAFAGSFGWPGLVHFIVADVMRTSVGGATLITQSGSYLGSTVGPLLFGLAFTMFRTGTPWALMAVCAAAAAISAIISDVLRRRYLSRPR